MHFGHHYPLAAFFVLACAISWLLWAPLWLPAFGVGGLPILPFNHALGAWGPLAAAFLVSSAEAGRAGTADLVRRMGLWRGRLPWIAVALFAPFVLLALAAGAWSVLGGEEASLAGLGRSREFPHFSAVAFLGYSILSFGYGEEVGWRGFALPRLQPGHSALVATLLLTVGWAAWHTPLFFYRPGYMSFDVAAFTGWFFSLLAGAVLLTWLYNESRGSILVVALFHAAVDVVFTSDLSSPEVVNAAGALVTVWGIVVLVVARPAYLSRRGKMVRLDETDGVTGFVGRDAEVARSAAR